MSEKDLPVFPEMDGDILELSREIDQLRTLLDGLMKAVEPFAGLADVHNFNSDTALAYITVGDLRRAREAYLKAKSQTNKEG